MFQHGITKPGASAETQGPIQVLIADDSAVSRGFIRRWLTTEPTINIAATANTGTSALEILKRSKVDVVILDVEMPEMDGMTALPVMLSEQPQLQIIMVSTLTQRNAEISIRALELGAADYIPKPDSSGMGLSATEFRDELVRKVKALARAARSRELRASAVELPVQAERPARMRPAAAESFRPEILAIGSSTGGPQAIFQLLAELPPSIGIPVLLTQHMPPAFTRILAQHISGRTEWVAQEAASGIRPEPGHVYVAPGDHHLELGGHGRESVLKVAQGPHENFCRPSVDVTFRSVAQSFGSRSLCLVLTGMGTDGLKGAQLIAERGGVVLAQDEASSVVWGMPGAVAKAGVANEVLPLSRIARTVVRYCQGGRP